MTDREAIQELESEAGDVERLFQRPVTQWRLVLRRFRIASGRADRDRGPKTATAGRR